MMKLLKKKFATILKWYMGSNILKNIMRTFDEFSNVEIALTALKLINSTEYR